MKDRVIKMLAARKLRAKQRQQCRKALGLKYRRPAIRVQREKGVEFELRHAIITFLGGRCFECGTRKDLQTDHIMALGLGGKNRMENIQVLCRKHHEIKTVKDLKEYRKRKYGW